MEIKIADELKNNHIKNFKKSLINIGIEDHSLIQFIIYHNILAKYSLYADEYLELLFDTVSKDTTIVMNCFTWNSFCQNGIFDIKKTPSEVGLASEIFRRMKNVIRSPHPIYSMCSRGPLSEDIMVHDGPTCWGDRTPFEQLVKHNCFCVSIGDDLSHGITLFHRFEEMNKVPYRFFKEFKGIVNFGNGEKEYSTKFFVRKDMDMYYSWKPALDILDKKGVIKSSNLVFPVFGVPAKALEKTCYNLLANDIEIFTKTKEQSDKDEP